MTQKISFAEAQAAVGQMNLTDNFLLEKTMADPGTGEILGRHIVETVLQRKIGNIRVSAQMSLPGTNTRVHGTRFDVFIEASSDVSLDASDEVFDIEAENSAGMRNQLPKRTRFYRSKIDSRYLPSGEDYRRLPDIYVIMITTFDPFGYDRMMYTIHSTCAEEPDMPYEDGAVTIFLNCGGTKDIPSEGIRQLLRFLQDTREENAVDDTLRDIYDRVNRLRNGEEVSIAYMKYYEEIWAAEYRGETLKVIKQVLAKLAKGKSVTVIADALEEDESYIQDIIDAIDSCGNSPSPEDVYGKLHPKEESQLNSA